MLFRSIQSRLVIEHSGDIDPDRWTQFGPVAHIAAGASQDAARSAEMRTTAFYLGTDVPEA